MYVITSGLQCDINKDGRDGIADQDQGASRRHKTPWTNYKNASNASGITLCPTPMGKKANKPRRKYTCQVHKQVAIQRPAALDSVHPIGTRDDSGTTGTSRYLLHRENCKRRPHHSDDNGEVREKSAKLLPTPPSVQHDGIESSSTRCPLPAAPSLMPGLAPPTLASNKPGTGVNKGRHRIENKRKRQDRQQAQESCMH